MVDQLWQAIRGLTQAGAASCGGQVISLAAQGVLLDRGGLLGLAAIVYLLAPKAAATAHA